MTNKWNKCDGGRSRSKRPLQKNDCVVRAFVIATKWPLGDGYSGPAYDRMYDTFADMGRKCGRRTAKKMWKSYAAADNGFFKMSFPAVKGQPRMTLKEFAWRFNVGRYVVQISKHLVAVINGEVYDDVTPRWNACVYAAYKWY